MSDESSDSDSATDKMIVHRPTWRSKSSYSLLMLHSYMHILYVIALSLFLEELDKRVDAQQKDMKKHVPKRRVRVMGESTDRQPPPDAPQWTIDAAWMEGYLLNYVLYI